jgi:hypothetical protein
VSAATPISSKLHWESANVLAPTLVDSGVPGSIVVAWLDGLPTFPGNKLLLGYVRAEDRRDENISLEIVHIDAAGTVDVSIPISVRGRIRD